MKQQRALWLNLGLILRGEIKRITQVVAWCFTACDLCWLVCLVCCLKQTLQPVDELSPSPPTRETHYSGRSNYHY